jgi:hypothetical protein
MEEVIGSIPICKSKYLANPTFSENGSCHQWNQVLVQRTDIFQTRQFYLAYWARVQTAPGLLPTTRADAIGQLKEDQDAATSVAC